jgi:hypothetical protein
MALTKKMSEKDRVILKAISALETNPLTGDKPAYAILKLYEEQNSINVEIATPWSESEVQAVEAFLEMSPGQRLQALVKQNADNFLASLLADYPDLQEKMRRGPGGEREG